MGGEVRGTQLCKTSKAGAASFVVAQETIKGGPAPAPRLLGCLEPTQLSNQPSSNRLWVLGRGFAWRVRSSRSRGADASNLLR
jgi:hypothetical protein